jgi:hypothetical protein
MDDTLFSIQARYLDNLREMNGDHPDCSKAFHFDPRTFWRRGHEPVKVSGGDFFLATNGSGTYLCDRTALIAEVTATANADGHNIVRRANTPDEALAKFKTEVDENAMYLLISAAEGTPPKK